MLGPPYELINAFTPKGWTLEELKSTFSSFGVLYGDGIKVSTNPKKNCQFKVFFTTTKGVLDAYKALNGTRCAIFDPTLKWNLSYSRETRLKLIALGLINESAQNKWITPIRMPPGPSTQLLHKSLSASTEKRGKAKGNEEKKIRRKQESLNALKQLEKMKKTSIDSSIVDLRVKSNHSAHSTNFETTHGNYFKETPQKKQSTLEQATCPEKETSNQPTIRFDPSVPLKGGVSCGVVTDVTSTKRECFKTGDTVNALESSESHDQARESKQILSGDERHALSVLKKKSTEVSNTDEKAITTSVKYEGVDLMETNGKELLLTDTQTIPYEVTKLKPKQNNSTSFEIMGQNKLLNQSNSFDTSTSVNKQDEMTGRKLSIMSLLKTQETCSQDQRSDEEKHLCFYPVSSDAMTEYMVNTKQAISASSSSIQIIETPQLYQIVIEPCIASDSWCNPFVPPSFFFPPILPYPFKASKSVDTTSTLYQKRLM